MRLEEYALHFDKSGGAIHSVNRGGEVLNTYVRHKPPLDLWRRNGGLRQTEYEAGVRYGGLRREFCQPKSPAHSETARIVVDGGGAGHDPRLVLARNHDFEAAQAEIGDEETIAALNRLCGLEDWPAGDKRRFKRVCRKGLERLAALWRRR